MGRNQRVDDRVEFTVEHALQGVERHVRAVIGQPRLRKIIRPNPFRSVARADHALARRGDLGVLFLLGALQEPRTQDFQSLGFVLVLRFFVLATHDQIGRQMGDAHRGIGRVHALPAGTGRAEHVDAQLFFVDVDVHLVGFGQHGHGHRGGVDAARRFGFGHALDAMHAALEFEPAVGVVPIDHADDFLEAAQAGRTRTEDFHAPLPLFGVVRIHPKEIRGEQAGFLAAGAGPDFQQHVLFVQRVLGQQQEPQLVFECRCALAEFLDFVVGHLAQLGVAVVEQGAAVFQIGTDFPPFAETGHDFLEPRVLLGELGVLLGVAGHFGQAQAAFDVFVAMLDVGELAEQGGGVVHGESG